MTPTGLEPTTTDFINEQSTHTQHTHKIDQFH